MSADSQAERIDFATTHWSVVRAAGRGGSRDSDHWRRSMAQLYEAYWYPLYAYLRRRGYSRDDTADLTQDFFAALIERDFIDGATEGQGRFRWFLMAAIKRFAANWTAAQTAQKRGGGKPVLSLDFESAEERYRIEPVDGWDADRLFERRWALTLLQSALEQVRGDYQAKSREQLFDALAAAISGDDDAVDTAAVAQQFDLTAAGVRTAIHRLRGSYRETIRRLIAETLSDEGALDEEIDDLMRAVSSAPSG